MKKTVMGVGIAALAVLSQSALQATVASAATQPMHTMKATQIVLNGKILSTPSRFVGGSPATTFVPIFYVQTLLNQVLGLNASTDVWDGHNWNLAVSGVSVKTLNSGSGSEIVVNGTVAEHVPVIADIDPSSGRPTTFMPIWYVQQLLNNVLNLNESQDVWDATSSTAIWTLSTNNGGPTSGSQNAKLDTVSSFMQALQIQGDASGTNPYNDVPESDWPSVHAAVEKGYFTPDSSTHFGSTDLVSQWQLDHAYQIYLGIPDSHMAWNAGGNTYNWGSDVGVTAGLGGWIYSANRGQVANNLAALNQGYYKDSSGRYHLVFKPYDGFEEFTNATHPLSSTVVANDLAQSIKEMDQVTLTVANGVGTFRFPGLSNQSKNELTCNTQSVPEYSFNGGASWNQATGFYGYDSRDPQNGGSNSPQSVIEVKGSTQGNVDCFVIENQQSVAFSGAQLAFSSNGIKNISYSRFE